MNAEEVREYTKNVEESGTKKEALGFFNGWRMKYYIRKIDRSIKREAERGETFVRCMFSERLHESDTKYLQEYYRNQGYHTERLAYSMRVGWSIKRPWWAK